MKKNVKLKTILLALRILFVLFICITFVVLLFQLHEIIYHCNPQSMRELIANPHVLKFLLIACFSLLTLYIAGKQLQKQTNIAAITALTELRKLLTSERNRQVHFALSQENDKTALSSKATKIEANKDGNSFLPINEIPMTDVYNYIGTIELGVEMVKRNLIGINAFYSQFGYRIENIFEQENSEIHSIVREHINNNKSYYRNLLWEHDRIRKKSIANK